jgi:hypothetical protein
MDREKEDREMSRDLRLERREEYNRGEMYVRGEEQTEE